MTATSTASRITIVLTVVCAGFLSTRCGNPAGEGGRGDTPVVNADSGEDISFNVDLRHDLTTEDSGLSPTDAVQDSAQPDQGEDLPGDVPVDTSEDTPIDTPPEDVSGDVQRDDGSGADVVDVGGDSSDGGGPTDATDATDTGTDPGTDTTDTGTDPGTDATDTGTDPGTDATDTGTDAMDVGTDTTDAGTDTTDMGTDATDNGTDIPGAGEIAIYLAGDLTPVVFEDGASGQTPRDYFIAVSAYQLVRPDGTILSAPCFDYGDTPVVADVHEDTLMGSCLTSAIPTATYTHGLVRVDWVRYTVDGTLHRGRESFPGEFEFFRAMSDTKYDGNTYTAGAGYLEFRGATSFRLPLWLGEMSDWEGLEFKWDEDNRDLWMQFPFDVPLPIESGSPDAHWARLHWEFYESFRWIDLSRDGYVAGVWDLVNYIVSSGTEQVVRSGFNGYHITTSLD